MYRLIAPKPAPEIPRLPTPEPEDRTILCRIPSAVSPTYTGACEHKTIRPSELIKEGVDSSEEVDADRDHQSPEDMKPNKKTPRAKEVDTNFDDQSTKKMKPTKKTPCTGEVDKGSSDQSTKRTRPTKKAPRKKTRDLLRWTDDMDKLLLLNIQYQCNHDNLGINWDAVGRLMGSTVSGGAVIQHLAKLRQRMAGAGHDVPPTLRRGGGSRVPNPPSLNPRGARKTVKKSNTAPKRRAAKKASADSSEEEYDSDSDADYGKPSAKRLRTGDKDKAHKNASEDGFADEDPGDRVVAAGASFLALQGDDTSESGISEGEIKPSLIVTLKANPQEDSDDSEESDDEGEDEIADAIQEAGPDDTFHRAPFGEGPNAHGLPVNYGTLPSSYMLRDNGIGQAEPLAESGYQSLLPYSYDGGPGVLETPMFGTNPTIGYANEMQPFSNDHFYGSDSLSGPTLEGNSNFGNSYGAGYPVGPTTWPSSSYQPANVSQEYQSGGTNSCSTTYRTPSYDQGDYFNPAMLHHDTSSSMTPVGNQGMDDFDFRTY